MANTYTVLVTVQLVADSAQEAHTFIKNALDRARQAEILMLGSEVAQCVLGDDDPDLAVIDSLD